jgi:hypothetical protein
MSRKLLAFLMSELKTVRIICQQDGCGVIAEIPIEELDSKMSGPNCLFCKRPFTAVPDNPFVLLAKAARKFKLCSNEVQIEFVIPDDGDKSTLTTAHQ